VAGIGEPTGQGRRRRRCGSLGLHRGGGRRATPVRPEFDQFDELSGRLPHGGLGGGLGIGQLERSPLSDLVGVGDPGGAQRCIEPQPVRLHLAQSLDPRLELRTLGAEAGLAFGELMCCAEPGIGIVACRPALVAALVE
jgi:hypothetical protein